MFKKNMVVVLMYLSTVTYQWASKMHIILSPTYGLDSIFFFGRDGMPAGREALKHVEHVDGSRVLIEKLRLLVREGNS
jgi:hypothetical protein